MTHEDIALARLRREWGMMAERHARGIAAPCYAELRAFVKPWLRLAIALGLAGLVLWCAGIRPPRPAGVVSLWGLVTGVLIACLIDGLRGGLIAVCGLGGAALFWVISIETETGPLALTMVVSDVVPLALILWLTARRRRSVVPRRHQHFLIGG